MSLTTLAEAIILQSAEDFMSEQRQDDDVAFFGGEGFRLCAGIAGMSHTDQCALLRLLGKQITVRRPVESKSAAVVSHGVALHA
jgi:hypothetical protein